MHVPVGGLLAMQRVVLACAGTPGSVCAFRAAPGRGSSGPQGSRESALLEDGLRQPSGST